MRMLGALALESGLTLEPSPVVSYLGEQNKPHSSAVPSSGGMAAMGTCLVEFPKRHASYLGWRRAHQKCYKHVCATG